MLKNNPICLPKKGLERGRIMGRWSKKNKASSCELALERFYSLFVFYNGYSASILINHPSIGDLVAIILPHGLPV